ncbi:MAG: hypothetical protein P8129_19045 [Anaerolineae bacterium]
MLRRSHTTLAPRNDGFLHTEWRPAPWETRNDGVLRFGKTFALLLACLLFLSACGAAAPATVLPTTAPTAPPAEVPAATPSSASAEAVTEAPTRPTAKAPAEQAITVVPLAGSDAGPVAGPSAEYSGLAWYGDWLILLPQYPGRFDGGSDGALLALARADVLSFLDGASTAPLEARPVPFSAPGVAADVAGFEGYEALAFDGDRAYLTIEAAPPGGEMRAYLIAGDMAPDLAGLSLDPDSRVTIPMPVQSGNKSYESLLLAGDRVLALYEANGLALSPEPAAEAFHLDLAPAGSVPFPQVEYRVTDATALDAEGRFWAINYFFPGEPELKPVVDPLAQEYGQGPTHAQYEYVERLIELQYTASGIRLVERPPIQLALIAEDARNWEGLVRLDGRGFLLVTDKFPETILAFVPGP